MSRFYHIKKYASGARAQRTVNNGSRDSRGTDNRTDIHRQKLINFSSECNTFQFFSSKTLKVKIAYEFEFIFFIRE